MLITGIIKMMGKMQMDVDDAAKILKELGHPARLKIFKRLVKAGFDGLPVGVLRDELGIPNSSMTHHIASLLSANLIVQERRGRVLQCIPKYDRLWNVIVFLQDECCVPVETGATTEQ